MGRGFRRGFEGEGRGRGEGGDWGGWGDGLWGWGDLGSDGVSHMLVWVATYCLGVGPGATFCQIQRFGSSGFAQGSPDTNTTSAGLVSCLGFLDILFSKLQADLRSIMSCEIFEVGLKIPQTGQMMI